MRLTGLDLFLWAASFTGHVLLLLILWIRGRARSFPIFTTLIALNVARTIVLFAIQRYGTTAHYFYTFWSFAALDVVLQLSVISEMAVRVFRPSGHWEDGTTKRYLQLWILCSLTVATGITWTARPQTTMWAQTALIRANFFSAALMSELFVGMITLSVTAHLPWATHVARISQGLGVYSMATLGLETARTYFGLKNDPHIYASLSHLRITIYLTCLMYWIIMLWRDAPPARQMPQQMRKQLTAVGEQAAQYVQILQSRKKP